MLIQQAGKLEAFSNTDDNRLFGEDRAAGLKPDADVVEMHMVGRPDHQQIKGLVGDQLFGGIINPTSGNSLFLQAGKASRGRIDIADDFEILVDFTENVAQISETESESDNSHFHEAVPCFTVIHFRNCSHFCVGRSINCDNFDPS